MAGILFFHCLICHHQFFFSPVSDLWPTPSLLITLTVYQKTDFNSNQFCNPCKCWPPLPIPYFFSKKMHSVSLTALHTYNADLQMLTFQRLPEKQHRDCLFFNTVYTKSNCASWCRITCLIFILLYQMFLRNKKQ